MKTTLRLPAPAKLNLFLHITGRREDGYHNLQTLFQLLDYSALSAERDTVLCEQWTRQHGIASIPISVFYEEPPPQHLLRFCFAKSDPVLRAATERLCEI